MLSSHKNHLKQQQKYISHLPQEISSQPNNFGFICLVIKIFISVSEIFAPTARHWGRISYVVISHCCIKENWIPRYKMVPHSFVYAKKKKKSSCFQLLTLKITWMFHTLLHFWAHIAYTLESFSSWASWTHPWLRLVLYCLYCINKSSRLSRCYWTKMIKFWQYDKIMIIISWGLWC